MLENARSRAESPTRPRRPALRHPHQSIGGDPPPPAATVSMTARAAWALGAPPSGSAMSRSSRDSASSWAERAGPSPTMLRHRRGERRRRAIPLQFFRNRALAEDEVGQQDRGNLDQIFELLLDQRDFVGPDHWDAGEGKFKRHGAGRSEACVSGAKRSVLRRFAERDGWRLGPTCRQSPHLGLDMGQCRQDD